MHYVYVLLCSDDKFYIGRSSDLRRRLREHQNGEVKSTKGRRPLKLIFYEAFQSPADASRRERYFKTTSGKRALKLMLREYLKGLS